MPPASRRATVLIVEDDPDVRNLYRTALTMAGYTVVAVDDGIAALRWMEGERPDIIILDLTLPRLSGRDLQREIASHAETRDIPICVVTGTATDEDLEAAGFECVLRKPVEPAQVIAAVRRLVPPPAGFSFFG